VSVRRTAFLRPTPAETSTTGWKRTFFVQPRQRKSVHAAQATGTFTEEKNVRKSSESQQEITQKFME
jgi:hypothetical protein